MRRSPLRRLAIAMLGIMAPVAPAAPAPARDASRQVIVKFRAQGPHALEDCAQALTAQGRAFHSATADGSDSLDRLHHRLGVRRVRALFRRSDGQPFHAQQRELHRRFERSRRRFPARAQRAPEAPRLPDLSHVYLVELPEETHPELAAALYGADPHVAYAQPNHSAQLQLEPNDPFFTSSGSWGQPYADLWGLHRIEAAPAWDETQGEGMIVAVVDSGIDYEHPDIAANVWINPGEDRDGNGVVDPSDFNGIDDDRNGFVDDLRGFDFANSLDANEDGDFDDPRDVSDADPFDDNGHGTHVSGTIAAVGNNGLGILGVAPRAQIMAVKGFPEGSSAPISDLARAIVYAAENGADVINNSWSCSTRCPHNPLAEDVVKLAHALGAVAVFSAGNQSDDVVFFSPENLRETIVVAASTERDEPTASTSGGFLVDVTAPGGGTSGLSGVRVSHRAILSLHSSGSQPGIDGDGLFVVEGEYLRLSGTSMAAPHVAGLAALLLALRPDLDYEDVRSALRLTADDLGAEGHDRVFGAGRINAARAAGLREIPDARAEIAVPRQGSIVSQRRGHLELRGTAAGADLESYALAFGRGVNPRQWTPIAGSAPPPVVEDVLALWPIEDLGDGAYVLRLAATARDGTVFEEFLQLSLERNAPTRISSPGPAAGHPAVSGDLVVWQSERPAPSAPQDAGGTNLFVSDLRTGRERPLSAGPGDQQFAAISGERIAWEDARQDGSSEVRSCRYDAHTEECLETTIAAGSADPSRPSVSDERIVWSENRRGTRDLYLCEAGGQGRACREQRIAEHPATQRDPLIDGLRLVWYDGREDPLKLKLFTCLLDPSTGDCPARAVLADPGLQFAAAVSEELVAWEALAAGLRAEVRLCELDSQSGACDPLALRAGALRAGDSGPAPALSGHRLVWEGRRGDQDLDIFFCEYDPVRKTCPRQRLTGSAAPQRNPDIDGNRVVWEDLRNGRPEIFTLELPSFDPIGERVGTEGEELRIRVSGRDPTGDPLALEATLADGEPLAGLGASFEDFGDSTGELRWRPGFDQAGSYAVTFTARATGRLHTSETIRIEVLDANRGRARRVRASRVSRSP